MNTKIYKVIKNFEFEVVKMKGTPKKYYYNAGDTLNRRQWNKIPAKYKEEYFTVIIIDDGNEKPRAYTEEEIKDKFLDHIWNMIDYWENHDSVKDKSSLYKLEGFAHSLLTTIDGFSGGICGFILAPLTHEDDKKYNISEGDNYYPQNHKAKVKCDIAGSLHEILFKKRPDHLKVKS